MSAREGSITNGSFSRLGMGVGLRAPHYSHILENLPAVGWFEAISENYMGIRSGSGGLPIRTLEKIREHYPIVLHGVSMSLGSTDPLDEEYLRRLDVLQRRIRPEWISDHLCWTGVEGTNLHDLLPLPYTEEAIRHVVARITAVQERLGRRMLVENVSSYVTYDHSEMTEVEFLSEVVTRADCGILLDINNIYVSSRNHGFDPVDYLKSVPRDRVGQFHLAGHLDKGDHLIDTHDHPVADPVWELYEEAIRLMGPVSTLLEWDARIPAFEVLEGELAKASRLVEENTHGLETDSAIPHGASALDALGAHGSEGCHVGP